MTSAKKLKSGSSHSRPQFSSVFCRVYQRHFLRVPASTFQGCHFFAVATIIFFIGSKLFFGLSDHEIFILVSNWPSLLSLQFEGEFSLQLGRPSLASSQY
jgi:hypothetical protein